MPAVEVDLGELRRELRALAARADNLGGAWKIVAEMLVTEVEDLVDSEGRGDWDPPAASTVERATRKGYRKGQGFGDLLRDTNHMVGNVQPHSDASGASASTPASYAGFHLEGTADMPARDFFDVLEDSFLDDVADILLREVAK